MSRQRSAALGAMVVAILLAIYFMAPKGQPVPQPTATGGKVVEDSRSEAASTPLATEETAATQVEDEDDAPAKPTRKARAFKPHSLGQEKERLTKQVARTQEKLERLATMSEAEWERYQKDRFARREALAAMTKEDRKAYYAKRREWRAAMEPMTAEQKQAYLKAHAKEMLPLEGEE